MSLRGTRKRDDEEETSLLAVDRTHRKKLVKSSQENIRRYELTKVDISRLEREGETLNIARPNGATYFYIVLTDIYTGRESMRFANVMQALKTLQDTTEIDGILIKPDVTKKDALKMENPLKKYREYLGPKVHVLTTENLSLVSFTNNYDSFLMDPLKVTYETLYRVHSPHSIHEGPTYNCGLASLLVTIATHDKPLFIGLSQNLAMYGKVLINGELNLCAIEDRIERSKSTRTVIEIVLTALGNTDTYAKESAYKINSIFQSIMRFVKSRIPPNKAEFIINFVKHKIPNFVANSPKMIVELLRRFGFQVQEECMQTTIMNTLNPMMPQDDQNFIKEEFYSDIHQDFSSENIIALLNHIQEKLEEGKVVITSINLGFNFKLISLKGQVPMSSDMCTMDEGLRPDHMVYTTKCQLNPEETITFGFCTFGKQYDVNVSLDEFKTGFRGCIIANK